MSSGFLLLETKPGREGPVLDRLATMPGVAHHHLLFPAAIAVKLEGARDALDPLAFELARLDGVLSSRWYRTRNA